MSNPHFERGQHLLATGRSDLAEKELRAAIAHDPHDGAAHALLSFCLAARKDVPGAIAAAQRAVVVAPHAALSFMALSHAYVVGERGKDAEAAARQALALEPDEPAAAAAVARALFLRERWADALHFAEHGLQHDPQNAECLRVRTLALVQLGRRDEADASVGLALAQDPEDDDAHAALGFVRLNQGDVDGAIRHFREALRLQPGSKFARSGLVEALKARNPLYALFLRYALWMSRQRTGVVLALVFGAPIVMRGLRKLGENEPRAQPWIIGLYILYWGFVLLSWFASPLFDLMLRLHPLGRHALDDDQRAGSRAFGLCLLGALAGAVAWGLGYAPGLTLAITAVAAAFPLVGAYGIRVGRARKTAFTLAGAVLCGGLGAFVLQATGLARAELLFETFAKPERGRQAPAPLAGDGFALLGVSIAVLVGVLSTWVVSALSVARPQR